MDDSVQQIVDVARSLAVLVRISGPDPRGRKMHGHAFYHANSGKTTLSSSGFLVPESFSNQFPIIERLIKHGRKNPIMSALAVTTASVVEPFLSGVQQDNGILPQGLPQLISGSQIDALVEARRKIPGKNSEADYEDPSWLSAELLMLVDVPTSSNALTSLLKGHGGPSVDGAWEVGWSLASSKNVPYSNIPSLQVENERRAAYYLQQSQSMRDTDCLSEPRMMAISTTRLAFLILSGIDTKDQPHVNISLNNKRGDFLLAVGSPFGILSPLHFFNSISVGVVANCCPSVASCSSLLMADIRCLPGTEGGPVFGKNACLVGILTRPLRYCAGGAEIQLVVPWDAIMDGVNGQLQNKFMGVHLESCGNVSCSELQSEITVNSVTSSQDAFVTINPSLFQLRKAMASIVLVTIGDGAWASGIVLNSEGLILTNAHILEPWRFREVPQVSGMVANKLWTFPVLSGTKEASDSWKQNLTHVSVRTDGSGDDVLASVRDPIYQGYGRIRIRLDHVNAKVWCDARVVYVSRGPLDIALLQIDSALKCICPVIPDIACPQPGSKAFVIGHGVFGPRSNLCPSMSSGVISRVVEMRKPHKDFETTRADKQGEPMPVMLETTAAVHPGGSGGGVFNSKGHLVGLVTSNARHSSGTIIPHLNFSIPCAPLEPVFKFSSDMRDMSILQPLERSNELAAIWSLVPPPNARSPLPESILDKKDGERGSRFAKFIKEHHAEKFLQRSSDGQGQINNNSHYSRHSKM